MPGRKQSSIIHSKAADAKDNVRDFFYLLRLFLFSI